MSSRGPAGLCTDRFKKYVVTVDSVDCASGDANGHLGYLEIPCKGWGRTVRLQLLSNDTLNLQYIGVVGTKVLEGATRIAMANARHSSQNDDECRTDSDAPDSMCVTKMRFPWEEMRPWWEATAADGALYDITTVVVRNRADCCWGLLQNYVVTVDGVECARGDANRKQGFLEIPCNKRGRTVRLQLQSDDDFRCGICRYYIGVEGTKAPGGPAPNAPAASKPDPTRIAMSNARQSSQYSSSRTPDVSFAADKCLTDSDAYDSMCITAGGENHPWWEASTADNALYDITGIVVRNRADGYQSRFQNYVVTVDGVECARGDANGKQGYLEIPCKKRGRTVRLQLLSNDHLNLQYIGVEGTKAP